MSYGDKPPTRHPLLPVNEIGLTRRDYEGAISTLCAGCGHDAISAAIIEACFSLNLAPHTLVKLSGIGCSSKTPNYFLEQAHGFNSVHGRMPAVATGAALAGRGLTYLGVSGDGDSASIGLGQLCHVIRRRLNMTYILENNGVYGLTKGQFSATNERASVSRRGEAVPFDGFDLCALAVQLGAGFVARSFSGDREQLVPLLQAAICFDGFAFVDVVSPCVTFNNHSGSMKSFDYVREHSTAVADLVPIRSEIRAASSAGASMEVQMHDGTVQRFRRLEDDYDPKDRINVLLRLEQARAKGEILTGLISCPPHEGDLHQALNTPEEALTTLKQQQLCPGQKAMEKLNASFR